MSEDPEPARPTREGLGRPPRVVVASVAVVAVLAVAWTAVWYLGTRRADAMVGAWLAEEATRGRSYECGERHLGGYPFRVEVRCDAPRLTVEDASPRVAMTAEGFRAVAQVWDLSHVIFEIDGPVGFETGPAGDADFAGKAEWESLRGSLRAPGGDVRRVDIEIRDFAGAPAPSRLLPEAIGSASARHVEIHVRRADEASATRDFDAALEARELVVGLPDGSDTPALDLAFDGRFGALPYPPPRDPVAFVEAWRANGGNIDVTRLSAAQGDTELRVQGRLVPDGGGRPEGRVRVLLAGPEVEAPGSSGAFGGLAAVVALALRFTGKPADIDGRAALAGEIELRDGQAFLGPVPIASLPRLF